MPDLDPSLEPYARPAIRLNPRPGAPTPEQSHIGGPLLWPADEPWPCCDALHLIAVETPVPPDVAARMTGPQGDYLAAVTDLTARTPGRYAGTLTKPDGMYALSYVAKRPPQPNPMVVIAQLLAADFPDLPYPDKADVLQVLWCPNDHADGWAPRVHLTWRTGGDVGGRLTDPPAPHSVGGDGYLPQPCVLDLESVTDYPWWQQLPRALQDKVRGKDLIAAGWKAGGHASWPTTDLASMECPACEGDMALLFTISSDEATSIHVGQSGSLRVFVCTNCPDLPYLTDLQ